MIGHIDNHKTTITRRPQGSNTPQLEEQLKLEQCEWETTVDSLDQVVLSLDSSGNILRGNIAAERWGLSKITKIKGQHFHNLFHPYCGDPTCYLRACWPLAQAKLKKNQPFIIERMDPVLKRFLLIQFRPVIQRDAVNFSQTAQSAIAVFQDITDSRESAESVQQAASELQAIFQSLPDKYIRLHPDGTILSFKEGSSPETFFVTRDSVGKNIQGVVPTGFREKFLDAFNEVKEKQTLVVLEYTYNSPEGEQIHEARFVPLFNREVDIICRNITENKKLLSIAEAMDAMKNLGYVFSGIRHEIGNPINAIKMTISVLKNNIDDFPKDRVLEYIDRVLTEINRVEYLLKNLKNFNMFEELNPKDIYLSDFMEKFLDLVQKDSKNKGIKVTSNIHIGVSHAYADARALHQVLLNIMSNAFDALEDVEEPRIIINVRKEAKKIRIQVEDNGHGIPESQQKDIFKPFFTTKVQGSGLGLNIVQKILSRMGGTIKIDSKRGSGSTATIDIPEGKRVS